MGSDARKSVREGLSAAQTVAALIVILLGITWYLRERPDAPRVELGITATPYPLDYPDVLVRTVFTLKNNGRAALALDHGESVTFYVQRLTPFDPAAVEQQLRGPTPEGAERTVRQPALAAIRRDRVLLNHMLETGEPDSLNYSTILNCDTETLVVIRASMVKPLQYYEVVMKRLGMKVPNSIKDSQVWFSETVLDLSEVCDKSKLGASEAK